MCKLASRLCRLPLSLDPALSFECLGGILIPIERLRPWHVTSAGACGWNGSGNLPPSNARRCQKYRPIKILWLNQVAFAICSMLKLKPNWDLDSPPNWQRLHELEQQLRTCPSVGAVPLLFGALCILHSSNTTEPEHTNKQWSKMVQNSWAAPCLLCFLCFLCFLRILCVSPSVDFCCLLIRNVDGLWNPPMSKPFLQSPQDPDAVVRSPSTGSADLTWQSEIPWNNTMQKSCETTGRSSVFDFSVGIVWELISCTVDGFDPSASLQNSLFMASIHALSDSSEAQIHWAITGFWVASHLFRPCTAISALNAQFCPLGRGSKGSCRVFTWCRVQDLSNRNRLDTSGYKVSSCFQPFWFDCGKTS